MIFFKIVVVNLEALSENEESLFWKLLEDQPVNKQLYSVKNVAAETPDFW